jgi:hypothetical protein
MDVEDREQGISQEKSASASLQPDARREKICIQIYSSRCMANEKKHKNVTDHGIWQALACLVSGLSACAEIS